MSKTLWLNIAGFVILSAQYFGDFDVIPPILLGYIILVGNFVIRLITKEPIARTIK